MVNAKLSLPSNGLGRFHSNVCSGASLGLSSVSLVFFEVPLATWPCYRTWRISDLWFSCDLSWRKNCPDRPCLFRISYGLAGGEVTGAKTRKKKSIRTPREDTRTYSSRPGPRSTNGERRNGITHSEVVVGLRMTSVRENAAISSSADGKHGAGRVRVVGERRQRRRRRATTASWPPLFGLTWKRDTNHMYHVWANGAAAACGGGGGLSVRLVIIAAPPNGGPVIATTRTHAHYPKLGTVYVHRNSYCRPRDPSPL